MKKTFNFRFEVICADAGDTDHDRVEQLIDLAMQDLIYDDEFISAVGEKQALTIRVSRLDERMVDNSIE